LLAKKIEKKIKISQKFFLRKIEYKTRSGTQFHQKSLHRTDFGFTTARNENFTSSESGHNNKGISSFLVIFGEII